MSKIIRVGLDFDGVLAYNPARVLRAYVKCFKRYILGIKRLTFMVPTNPIVRILWILAHESSIFPAQGVGLLRELANREVIEFHLITGRYAILENQLWRWLKRNKLEKLFKTVNINRDGEQPHLFKLAVINKLKLDYYVEDNMDIVGYIAGKTEAKIFWIYNVVDRNKKYPHKFPYLEKALMEIKV